MCARESPTSTTTTTTTLSAAAIPRTHPTYAELEAAWRKLGYAAEGTGGFADGTYLIAHPREYLDHTNASPSQPTKKLKERRSLARYENWPETILRLLSGALFRQAPVRRAGSGDESEPPHPIEQWWANVDGRGTDIDTWLSWAWKPAAVFGHAFCILDRPELPAQTAADAPGLYLRGYSPLDVPDWLVDDMGDLVAVRLLEALPRLSFDVTIATTQVRDLTPEGWVVRSLTLTGQTQTAPTTTGRHDFQGALPVVVLYSRRRPLTPIAGQSVLGDPQLYIDDYNLTSEIRELLRKQTFSLTNVPLGVGPEARTVEEAQAMIGTVTGTSNVLFTPLPAQMLSADSANVTIYQAERQELRRTMFRMAGLPWDTDSASPESADSRRIKREDLNQTLGAYADELQHADRKIAELWFRATYGVRWEAEWEAAQVTIDWPETFDSEVLDDVIARATQAMALRLGKTATDELKTRIIDKLLPALPPNTRQEILAEIEAMPDPEEERQAQRAALQASLTGARRMPAASAEDDDDEPSADEESSPDAA